MSRGPGRIERALSALLQAPPASNTQDQHRSAMTAGVGPAGTGPVGISAYEAAMAIFGTDEPNAAQRATVHRAALRLLERGDAVDLGRSYVAPGHRYVSVGRIIGRPRTPEEQAAYDAWREECRIPDEVYRRLVGGE